MGCDIHGRVEILYSFSLDEWFSVIDAGLLLDRNYDAFGLLFGVRNRNGFPPIAANRGLPEDASEEVKRDGTPGADADEDSWILYHSASWLTLEEIQAVDWDEAILEAETEMDEAGANTVKSRTRRSLLGASFEMVFELMEVLGKNLGPASVRLVVWFDN